MRRRTAVVLLAVLVAGAAYGQWSMWDRYGVFTWWSTQPRFLQVDGRGYQKGNHDEEPKPHYCLLDKAFPFNYPVVAATRSGIDGGRCEFTGTPTVVYLRWKDQPWRPYVLLGAP